MRLLLLGTSLLLLALFVGLGVPFIRRRIGPNGIAGIRTPETLGDPSLWYEANEYAGRLMVWGGLAIGLIALVLYFIPSIGDQIYAMLVSLAMVLILALLAAQSLAYTHRLAEAAGGVQAQVSREWQHKLRTGVLIVGLAVSVLPIALSIPLALGQISPNPSYGLRLPETLSNPTVWYKANIYAAELQILTSLVVAILVTGLYFIRRIGHVAYLVVGMLLCMLSPFPSAIMSLAYVRTLTGH